MDAVRTSSRRRLLHRIYLPPAVVGSTTATLTKRLFVAQAIWFALVASWLELICLGVHELVVGNVTLDTHRMHRFHAFLNIIGHLGTFAVWTLVCWPFLRWATRSRRLDSVMVGEGVFLILISAMLAIEEFYWPCALTLAVLFAIKFASKWAKWRIAIMSRTLVPLVVSSTGFLIASLLMHITAEPLALAALPPARNNSPNVVLLILDTVRADHLSVYGYKRKTTPFLEELTQRSIRFEMARSPAPWTLPSHASIFTGRWPHELSADVAMPLNEKYPTLAEFMATKGYVTGGFTGNTVYTNSWFGVDRGFSHYEDTEENKSVDALEIVRSTALGRAMMPWLVRAGVFRTTGYRAERKTAESIREDLMHWVDTSRNDRPFFAFLNFFDAHDPYEIPEGFKPQYTKESTPEILRANRLYFQHMGTGGDRAKALEPMRIVMDVYDDSLLYLDTQIHELFNDLERRGLAQTTWVIITADHGEFFGEHDRFGHGSSLYRPVIDVPLMVVPPQGTKIAKTIPEPASPRDIAATVADIIGATLDSPFPGQSLRRFWDGSGMASTSDVPLSEMKLPREHFPTPPAQEAERYNAAVIQGDRIFIRNRSTPDELYDVEDRKETRNLAPKGKEKTAMDRLRRLVNELQGLRDK